MTDLARIANFITAHPSGFPNLIDLPYRLASWSLEDSQRLFEKPVFTQPHPGNLTVSCPSPIGEGRLSAAKRGEVSSLQTDSQNLRLWETGDQIQAVAMLQMPWSALDYAYHPGVEHLVPAIFDWAVERAAAAARQNGSEFTLVLYIPPARASHTVHALARGFRLEDDWTIVHLSRSLVEPVVVPELPAGFAFRPLRGDSEVEAYVRLHQAAFDSTMMRLGWRARTLTMPMYRPELDLFIVNDDDQPVAFCIGWVHPDGTAGQIEPLGVHPDYQRLGLGKAVLLEGLRRLQAGGVARALIDSYKSNDPALMLYQTADNGNFRPEYEKTAYVRTFTP